MRAELAKQTAVPMALDELIVGTVCGGSDGTSGITANPAVGRCFDWLIESDAACIFEETGELIGCERIMARAPSRPSSAARSRPASTRPLTTTASWVTAASRRQRRGRPHDARREIHGRVFQVRLLADQRAHQAGDMPPRGGLYLLDVVPDGEPRFGFPNISDNAEIVELIACGSHLILFTTGRGSVVGSAISPVIKVCANPDTYDRMADDMDVNAGRILRGAELDEVGARSSIWCSGRGGEPPSPRRSATRNSSSPTNNSNRSVRPACRRLKSRRDS
jgi:altronate hydrolase